jgi:hypothetical protein
VSDFVSRLIARSSGERPAVRPRIAPSFDQLPESADRTPAGEILRKTPEIPRAIAPLPMEGQRAALEKARAEQNSETQAASRSRYAPQLPPASYFPLVHENPRYEEREKARPNVEAAPRTGTVTLTASTVPTATVTRDERMPATVTTPIETAPAPVLEAVAIKRQTIEELKVVAREEPTAAAPPVSPTVRPVIGKAYLPLDASKKKPASEPTIQVTIGKIEVRASITASKSAEKKIPTGAMSLEEYQRMRSRRSAG